MANFDKGEYDQVVRDRIAKFLRKNPQATEEDQKKLAQILKQNPRALEAYRKRKAENIEIGRTPNLPKR